MIVIKACSLARGTRCTDFLPAKIASCSISLSLTKLKWFSPSHLTLRDGPYARISIGW